MKPSSPDAELSRWQSVFDAAPFVRHLGVQVRRASGTEVETSLELQPVHLQHTGQVHAGVLTTLADHSAGAAAFASVLAGGGGMVVTAELKLSLLRAAKGRALRCVARVVKPGRQLVFTEADVWCDDGEREHHVARLSATMAVLPAAPSP